MDIQTIDTNFLLEERERKVKNRKLSPQEEKAWRNGWDTAISLYQDINKGIAFCSRCGKVIKRYDDYWPDDSDGKAYCTKCRDIRYKQNQNK